MIGAYAAILLSLSQASTTSACELHVWPTADLENLPLVIGQMNWSRSSAEKIDNAMNDLLGPKGQLVALRGVDLVQELGMPASTRIIEHDEPLDRKTLGKIKSRRAPSTARCYAELIADKHWLIEDIMWGDRFLSFYRFRSFTGQDKPDREVNGVGGNKLKVLTLAPDKRPPETPQLVEKALQDNLREYAKNARTKIAQLYAAVP